MKVAIDVTPIRTTGEMGGAFQLVVELIKGLGKRYKEDQFILLTAKWNHDYFKSFESLGIRRSCIVTEAVPSPYKVLGNKIIRKLSRLLKINIKFLRRRRLPLLKSQGVDVLFCPMSAVNYKEPGIPTVSLIYDLQHEYYPQFFTEDELAHRKKFYQGICEMADYITCISEFTRQTYIEKLKYPKERAEVIYISIQDRLKPDEQLTSTILNKFGIGNSKYAYFPANFWHHKNHRMLLVAYSIFISKYPDTQLQLVLTGSLLGEEPSFNELIKQMNLEQRVLHLGYVSEEEVSGLMAGAQFLIFPSLFEGFGIPVAEAMGVGTPVLCSNNTSLPEVGGEAAQYFDPRRPEEMATLMYRMTTDVHLRESSTRLGYEQIKKFNNEKMIEQYYRLLKKAAKSKSNKGTFIHGIYEDNWAKRDVGIFVESTKMQLNIIMEIVLPEFVPYRTNKVELVLDDKVKLYSVRAGESLVINETLPQSCTEVSVKFSDDFRPAEIGMNDERELAALINRVYLSELETDKVVQMLHGSKKIEEELTH